MKANGRYWLGAIMGWAVGAGLVSLHHLCSGSSRGLSLALTVGMITGLLGGLVRALPYLKAEHLFRRWSGPALLLALLGLGLAPELSSPSMLVVATLGSLLAGWMAVAEAGFPLLFLGVVPLAGTAAESVLVWTGRAAPRNGTLCSLACLALTLGAVVLKRAWEGPLPQPPRRRL